MNQLEKLKSDPVSRRAFLGRMSAAGLGVAAVALLDGCGGGSNTFPNGNGGGNNGGTTSGKFPLQSLPGNNDNQKVLNFALTLEILEADLYRQALNIAAGKQNPTTAPLTTSGDYNLAVPAGGINAQAGFTYLRDFAFVEKAHAEFLMMALSGAPQVQRNPKGYTFGPFTPTSHDLKSLLTALYPLEEEGVSAYLGAAPFITDLGTLQTAVTIYSTEARHSAAIAYILNLDSGTGPSKTISTGGIGPRQQVVLAGVGPLPPMGPNNESDKDNVFEYFIAPTQVVQDIQPLIVK